MDTSTPGASVLHYLPEFVKFMSFDVVMLSVHLILCFPLSPFTFNLSQHRGLLHWMGSSNEVVKVLELQLQHQSFQWIFSIDFLYDWLVWSPCSPRDSQESSPTPQFKSINSLALRLLYGATHFCSWLQEKPSPFWRYRPLLAMWCLCLLIHCLELSLLVFQGASVF